MFGLAAASTQAAVIVTVESAGATAPTLSGYDYSVADLNGATNGLASMSFAGSAITG